MDQEIATEVAEVSWPELSADLTLARTQARSIMLDTQRANSDGRILEIAAQLELMRTRMTSLEQHLFESQSGVAQDLIERLGNIDSALHATEVRFNGFANRISAAEEFASTTMLSTTTAIDARIDAAEVARRAQATELEELSSFLEQSFTRIAELSDLVESERAQSITDRQDHDARFAALTSKFASIEQSISDFDARIDEAADKIEYASVEAVEELKNSMSIGSSRIDESNSRIDEHDTRLDQWAARIEEDSGRIGELSTRVDQTDSAAAATNERVAALDEQLEQQSNTQDEIASAIHFLQSRAEALEASAASQAEESVEQLSSTTQRLDKSFADITALRAEIEAAEPEVSGEVFDELVAKVEANGSEQAAIVRTLDEVAAGLEARIQQQDGVLEAHSTILESTTQLLSDHHAIAVAHSNAIAEAQARSATHEESLAGTTHAIADLTQRADVAGRRVGEANDRAAELEHRADETRGEVAELSERVNAASDRVTELNQTVETTTGQIAELTERVDAHRSGADELSSRVSKAEQAAQQAIVAAASSASTSEAVLRTKTAELESRLEQATERIDGLVVPTTDDDDTAERVGALEPVVEQQSQQIEAVNDWVTALDRQSKKAEKRANTAEEKIEALNDWSTELDSRIVEIKNQDSNAEETLRTIETVKAQNTELGERTSVLEETTSGLLDKLEEVARTSRAVAAADPSASSEEVRSLNTRIDELRPEVDVHAEKIEAVNDWVTVVDGRILDIQEQGNTTQQQIEAVNDWVTVVDGRILDIQEQGNTTEQQIEAVNDWVTDLDRRSGEMDTLTKNLGDRTSDIDQRTSHLEERFGDTERRIEQLDEERANFSSQQSEVSTQDLARLADQFRATTPRLDTQDEKIEAINDWVTVVDGRILEIHQQGSSAEQQFEAINDWSTTLDGRILELQRNGETVQQQIEAVNDWSTTLDGRILDIQEQGNTTQQQIEAVNDWVTVVDGRILELNNDGEVVQQQIEAVNDWATNLEIRSYDMDTRLAQSQQVLVEMTKKLTILFERDQPDAGLKRQVDELSAATAQLQAKANDQSASVDADAFSAQVAATQRSVADLQNTVQEWIRNLEQARTNATNELRDFMVYRIDTAEDRIDRRLADIEASGSGNERLEAIERAVAEADERARDAYAFSENLRLLQTDLVQAIRGEMATQAKQIDRHSQALQSGSPLAPSDQPSVQLSGVNARIDEVTRGLSHLNEIQQRHGTIESKLTEALTSTNGTLKQTQQDVAALQSGLQAALARIDQLEGQVAAGQQQL